MTLQEYHTLCEKFPTQTFPFGLQICTKHKKKLSNQTTSASIGSNPPEIHDKYSYDSVYVPEHFEATPESRKVLDELSSIIEKSPMKFQISKPVSTLQLRTLRYVKKRVNEIQ